MQPTCIIIVITNQNGSVGKTTAAENHDVGLARHGKKLLAKYFYVSYVRLSVILKIHLYDYLIIFVHTAELRSTHSGNNRSHYDGNRGPIISEVGSHLTN